MSKVASRFAPPIPLDDDAGVPVGFAIPHRADRLMSLQTVWSHRNVQFSHEVRTLLNERIWDAAQDKERMQHRESDRDVQLAILVEQDWGWDYFANEVIPYFANYVTNVFNLVVDMVMQEVSASLITEMVCDFADWMTFDMTGEFHTTQMMAELVATRIKMESRK